MKNYYLILFASISFFGCRSSDDNQTNSTPTIVGTWKMTKDYTISGKDNSTILSSYTPNSCESKGTDVYTDKGGYTENLFQNIGGTCTSLVNSGTYTYDATSKKLTIIITGLSNETDQVLLLDEHNMQLQYDEYDTNGDGYKDKSIMAFTR